MCFSGNRFWRSCRSAKQGLGVVVFVSRAICCDDWNQRSTRIGWHLVFIPETATNNSLVELLKEGIIWPFGMVPQLISGCQGQEELREGITGAPLFLACLAVWLGVCGTKLGNYYRQKRRAQTFFYYYYGGTNWLHRQFYRTSFYQLIQDFGNDTVYFPWKILIAFSLKTMLKYVLKDCWCPKHVNKISAVESAIRGSFSRRQWCNAKTRKTESSEGWGTYHSNHLRLHFLEL